MSHISSTTAGELPGPQIYAELLEEVSKMDIAPSAQEVGLMGVMAHQMGWESLESKQGEALEKIIQLTEKYLRKDGEICPPPLRREEIVCLTRKNLEALHTDAMKSWLADDFRGETSREARIAKLRTIRSGPNRATMMEVALRAYRLEIKVIEQQHVSAEVNHRALELEAEVDLRSLFTLGSCSFKAYAPPAPKNMENLPFEAFELYTVLWPQIAPLLRQADSEKLQPYLPLFKLLAHSEEPTQRAFGEFILLVVESNLTGNEAQTQRDERGLHLMADLHTAFTDEALIPIARVVTPALVTLSHAFALETRRCLEEEGSQYDWAPFVKQTRERIGILRETKYLRSQAEKMRQTIEALEDLIQNHPRMEGAPVIDKYEETKTLNNPSKYESLSLKQLPPFDLEKMCQLHPPRLRDYLALEAAPQAAPKKKKKKKKKAKTKEPAPRPNSPISVTSEPEMIEIPRELSPREKLFASMQKALPLNSLKRVSRWQKVRSANQVRAFEGYQTEEAPAVTWLHHGFSPLVDKLITSDELRAKYAYQTKRGFGLVAQIEQGGKMERGIIYYGINKAGQCYHRMFHPCALNKFLNEDILNIAQEVENGVHDQPIDEMDSGKEAEDDFIGDTWDYRERFGSLTFTDDKHKAKIHICRLPKAR